MTVASEERPGLVTRALSSIETMLGRVAKERQAAQVAEQDRVSGLRLEYVSLLCRADRPQSGDESRLAEVIGELNIPVDAVRVDAREVDELKAACALALKIEDATANAELASAELRSVKERHRKELAAAELRGNEARRVVSRCSNAVTALRKAFSNRPDFFAPGGLSWPAGIPRPVAEESKPVRKGAPVYVQTSGPVQLWQEPVIGEDGEYLRDASGKYVLPGQSP